MTQLTNSAVLLIGHNTSKPAVEAIDNTELVTTFHAEGGRVVHIRPEYGTRGMTFAYRIKGGRIEVATSVQHRHDTFTKKVGTKLAIEHFHAGKTVFFPLTSQSRQHISGILSSVSNLFQY